MARAIREKDSTVTSCFCNDTFWIYAFNLSFIGWCDWFHWIKFKWCSFWTTFRLLKEALKHQKNSRILTWNCQGENSCSLRWYFIFWNIANRSPSDFTHKNSQTEFYYGTIAEVAKSDERLFKRHRSFVINK